MQDLKFKQLYTIISLGATVAWAVFCVIMTWTAIRTSAASDILTSSGSGVLLGAMLGWHGNISQYWFRKAPPDCETEGNPDTGAKP